jgi:predicted DNA-binding transcriptional regulator AlpA
VEESKRRSTNWKKPPMRRRNTVRKIKNQVVTCGEDGTPVPLQSTKPDSKAGHSPLPRGPPDPLLTTQEVAKFLQVSVSALNKWRLFGTGPKFIKVERRVRYRLSDIAAYLAASTRTSTSQTSATA